MNGLSHSPQQQQQQHMLPPQQQQKSAQLPNGIRPIDSKKPDDVTKSSDRLFPYGTKSLQEPLTNGRRHPYPDRPIEKIQEINEKCLDNNDRSFSHNPKNSMAPPMSSNVPNSSSLFPKPFKVPTHHDKSHPVVRPISNHIAPSTPTETGENVENILKMMTSTLSVEPLSKIAATPRNELEVQQPSRNHIYATGLPPMFRGSLNQRKFIINLFN